MSDPSQTAYEARFAGEEELNRALNAAYHEARSLAEQAGVSWKDAKRIADVYYSPAIKNEVEKSAVAEAEVAKLTRERDEARAEVTRLRKDNERLRWRHPAVLPDWNDLPEAMRVKLSKTADCFDPDWGGDLVVNLYRDLREDMNALPSDALGGENAKS